jgi:hypothetical protein
MRIENVFPPPVQKEIIIVRRNGQMKHAARDVCYTDNEDIPTKKSFFPISKERK